MSKVGRLEPLLNAERSGRLNGAYAWLRSIAGASFPRRGVATYSVVDDMPSSTVERRLEIRRRTYLRSGKALAPDERFLCEFSFIDGARSGIRMRLARNIALPKLVLLFDDQQNLVMVARVVWQRGRDAGCRMSGPLSGHNQRLIARLRSPYYAVR